MNNNNNSFSVNAVCCAIFTLGTMFFARDCHISSSFDNANPFSAGFLEASDVQKVIDRHVRKSWDGTTLERCIANTHIRDAYRKLPYRADLAETYDAEVRQWCGIRTLPGSKGTL